MVPSLVSSVPRLPANIPLPQLWWQLSEPLCLLHQPCHTHPAPLFPSILAAFGWEFPLSFGPLNQALASLQGGECMRKVGGCSCQGSGLPTWGTHPGPLCVGPGPACWLDPSPHCLGLVPVSSVKKVGFISGESMANTFGDHSGRAQGCLGEAVPSQTGPEVEGLGQCPGPGWAALFTLWGSDDVQWPGPSWPALHGVTYKAGSVSAGRKPLPHFPAVPRHPACLPH